MPQALSVVWDLIKSNLPAGEKMATILDFDKILGLDLAKMKKKLLKIPSEIKEMAGKRESLRKEKNWSAADQLRQEINQRGFQIEDTEQGIFIRRKS